MTRLIILLALLATPTALAHIQPSTGEGATPERPIWLGPDTPAADLGSLPAHGGIQYYSFSVASGQTVTIQLSRRPDSFLTGAPPGIAIIGPNLTSVGPRPPFLEVAPSDGAEIWRGVISNEIHYHAIEAIAVSPVFMMEFTAPASGRYELAVFDEDDGGAFLLEIDEHDTFSFHSYFVAPTQANDARAWEGQSSRGLILAPLAGAIAAILLHRLRWPRARLANAAWGAIAASIIFAGSAASYAHQAFLHRDLGFPVIVPTIALALAAGITAVGLAATARSAANPPGLRTRLQIGVLAVFGFFCWTGALWGPGLAVAAALLPEDAATRSDDGEATP